MLSLNFKFLMFWCVGSFNGQYRCMGKVGLCYSKKVEYYHFVKSKIVMYQWWECFVEKGGILVRWHWKIKEVGIVRSFNTNTKMLLSYYGFYLKT